MHTLTTPLTKADPLLRLAQLHHAYVQLAQNIKQ